MSDVIANKIFHQLIDEITTGKILSGVKLKEKELSERLGCSRGPLREAIRRLEAKRLVSIIPNAGAQVVTLEPEDLSELYLVREAMEGMGARLAAKNMTDDQINAIRNALHDQKGGEQDVDMNLFSNPKNLDFHFQVIQGSGNRRLFELLCNDLYFLIMLYRQKYSNTASKINSHKRHLEILNAIEDREEELAEMLMRRHIKESRESILRTL